MSTDYTIDKLRKFLLIVVALVGYTLLSSTACPLACAESGVELSTGQTIYVPVYSHVYAGDREQPIFLAATLSIRNTDIKDAITITKADYYDSDGRMIKRYVEKPLVIKAMSAARYVIKESDKIGGSGANFVVQWISEKPVNKPLVESVMISTRSALGISFNSRGQVIQDRAPDLSGPK